MIIEPVLGKNKKEFVKLKFNIFYKASNSNHAKAKESKTKLTNFCFTKNNYEAN